MHHPSHFLNFITQTVLGEQCSSSAPHAPQFHVPYVYFVIQHLSLGSTWLFYTAFQILWTVLCSGSLDGVLVTFMAYVQEIHSSKSQWDFGSFCCPCMQMLVQVLKLGTEHWPPPVQSCCHLMLHRNILTLSL